MQQIKYDPRRFGFVCKMMVQSYKEMGEPIRSIRPLKLAIERMDAKDHLTPQHCQLALACVLSKTYKTALPMLDNFVFQIEPDLTGVRSEDTRLYFYYGALCYIAAKQWTRAAEFCEIVISAPAVMASAIMVEAYKRYVLVTLIFKGDKPTLPKVTSPSVTRVVKQLSTPYEDLSNAFTTRDIQDLYKCIENNSESFIRDGNLGLVRQVARALESQNICRLKKTYTTLSLDSVTQEAGLKTKTQTEQRLLRLVEDGQLQASVNQKDSYILFLDNQEEYVTSKMVTFLDQQIRDTVKIHQRVLGVDRNIEGSDKYTRRILSGEKGGRFEEEFIM